MYILFYFILFFCLALDSTMKFNKTFDLSFPGPLGDWVVIFEYIYKDLFLTNFIIQAGLFFCCFILKNAEIQIIFMQSTVENNIKVRNFGRGLNFLPAT